MFLYKTPRLKKNLFIKIDMGRNVFGQSDCRIFRPTIFPEQIDTLFFFCFLTQIHENQLKFIESFWLVTIKNEWGFSGHLTLKLAVLTVFF